MSWLWVVAIIFGVLATLFVVLTVKNKDDWDMFFGYLICAVLLCFFTAIFIGSGIGISMSVKEEMLRYEKERQQIVYQIENLTEDKDKIKLNEWILTYNDWVNDVNTDKETYGWFSKYYGIDMTEHTIIDLV